MAEKKGPVRVKARDVDAKGMEIAIRDRDGKFLGDLMITPSQIIWCTGKTHPSNGKKIDWASFIKWMEGVT